ncbi:MAG: DUF1566 domain-containing protein [Sphaerochaeta sp.]
MKYNKLVIASCTAVAILFSATVVSCGSSSTDEVIDTESNTVQNHENNYPAPPPGVGNAGTDGISKDQGQFWSSNYDLVTEEGSVANITNTTFGVNETTGHIKGYPSDGDNPMAKHVRAVSGSTYGTAYTYTEVSDDYLNNQSIVAAAENSLIDNGDGTITDTSTGLMWMKDDAPNTMEWKDALSYAENLDYAGYTDWKLPDVKELQSIVDYTGVYPTLDESYFNITDFEDTNPNYYFWTSTSAYFGGNNTEYGYAWYVAFGFSVGQEEDSHGAGAVRFSPKYVGSPFEGEGGDNITNSVRACRIDERYYADAPSKIITTGQSLSYDNDGNVIYPQEGDEYYGQDAVYETVPFSFTDNGDGTVTDNNTGLIWQQQPSDDHLSIDSTLEYVDSLKLGESDDWRVPTLEELYSIQDYSEGWPYADLTYFYFPSAASVPNVPGGPQGGGPQGGGPQGI